jgi:uracil-DNA glycosylase family 4
LHRFGYSNRPTVADRKDGLTLKDDYITNVVKCAPPNDKPVAEEYLSCSPFLLQELASLKNVKVVLTLGKNSFDRFKVVLKTNGIETKGLTFQHGATYRLGSNLPVLMATYHSSQRNTNTGRLTKEM